MTKINIYLKGFYLILIDIDVLLIFPSKFVRTCLTCISWHKLLISWRRDPKRQIPWQALLVYHCLLGECNRFGWLKVITIHSSSNALENPQQLFNLRTCLIAKCDIGQLREHIPNSCFISSYNNDYLNAFSNIHKIDCSPKSMSDLFFWLSIYQN